MEAIEVSNHLQLVEGEGGQWRPYRLVIIYNWLKGEGGNGGHRG